MNALADTNPVVIVVPPVMAALLAELAERMARTLGEPIESSRRCVEISVLTQGAAAVQVELAAAEKQAERNGWSREVPTE